MYPEMSERKGDVVYPHFHIDIKHLPEAKEWEIGKTYEVTLQVRQTGLNLRRHEGKKEDYGDADFEIVGIEPRGEVKKESRHSRAGGKPNRSKNGNKRYSRDYKK